MPLTAVRHVRKMRGGAQSHLLEADDGHWYVVKFRNNPQHHRVLVNELLSSEILAYLKIATPETALIHLTGEFLKEYAGEIAFTQGTRRIAVEAGWHFGSRYPGDPSRTALYDFLPDDLLPNILNPQDFLAVLVFDKWAANADGRQAVFYRALVKRAGDSESPAVSGLVARMIDHGFIFDGPNWDFVESPVQGLYARHVVYRNVRSLEDFQPWLDQVVNFPEEVIDRAWKRIPAPWIESEEDALERLLERLFERRKRVPDLICACRQGSRNPFPAWK